jgi:type I restriction enzyme S subunit
MKIVVPSPSEQDQIVRFLDWKVSSINKLIKTKKWQINSYKELAKAKIESQLNNYPIEKNVLLKNLGMFFKGGGFSRKDLIEDNKYPAILYGDIYTQYEYKTSTINHFIDSDTYTASRKIINGDIVMAGTGETKEEIGKPILYTGNQMVAVGGDIIVFRPYKMGNAEYLLYQLYSQAALKHRYINGKGDIIVHIYPTTLGNTPISLPSDSDQMKAVEKINKIINQTNKTTALLIEEITTLKEFKTRLISDVVTGQIDVRNIEIPEYEYVDEELESDSDDVDGDFDSEDISEEA